MSVLPTPAFFYGLFQREEITFEIEEGKTLIVRLVNVSEPDKDGRRTVTYEFNGMTREAFIAEKKSCPKRNPAQRPISPIPCRSRRRFPV